eukprot:scaffold103832_cov15-Prasinocladus_malaysianus.AAC.1
MRQKQFTRTRTSTSRIYFLYNTIIPHNNRNHRDIHERNQNETNEHIATSRTAELVAARSRPGQGAT